jgi:hypothetical protein
LASAGPGGGGVVVVVEVDVVVVGLEVGTVLTGVPPVDPAGFDVTRKSATKSAAGTTTPRTDREVTRTPFHQR